MNSLTDLTPQQLRQAAGLQEQILDLQAQLNDLLGSPSAVSAAAPRRAAVRGNRGRISAAGRARIAAAARARWAKFRSARKANPRSVPVRRMSPAARKRLAAIARARWARVKAAGQSRL